MYGKLFFSSKISSFIFFPSEILVDKSCKHWSLSCSKYCESITWYDWHVWYLEDFWMYLFNIYLPVYGDVLDLAEAAVCKKEAKTNTGT